MQTLRCAGAELRRGNIVDLEDYRRSLGLESAGEVRAVGEDRASERRDVWGIALDLAASAAVLVMALIFTLRVLVL